MHVCIVTIHGMHSGYRFHDHWRNTLQRLVFLASLTDYLVTGKLLSRNELSEKLGSEWLGEYVNTIYLLVVQRVYAPPTFYTLSTSKSELFTLGTSKSK